MQLKGKTIKKGGEILVTQRWGFTRSVKVCDSVKAITAHRVWRTSASGFTLVEVMVAVAIFASVVILGIGSVISVNNAYNNTQAQRLAFDNLNGALETITRDLRVGTSHHCGLGFGNIDDGRDCPVNTGGATSMAVQSELLNNRVCYRLDNNQIMRAVGSCANSNYVAMTGTATENRDDFEITMLRFYVEGAEDRDDGLQPMVTVRVGGTVTVLGQAETFELQTTVSQRLLDVQQDPFSDVGDDGNNPTG